MCHDSNSHFQLMYAEAQTCNHTKQYENNCNKKEFPVAQDIMVDSVSNGNADSQRGADTRMELQ